MVVPSLLLWGSSEQLQSILKFHSLGRISYLQKNFSLTNSMCFTGLLIFLQLKGLKTEVVKNLCCLII